MSLRSFVAVIAASAASLASVAAGARAEALRVTAPATHGAVAVYFLRGASAGGPLPLTLDEALSKGAIDVVETGNVRELKIENKGTEPVFVQLGDIVKGGRQDRVLAVSLLLEPRSGLVPIGAYCVEKGRWSARDKEDAHKFARSETLLPSASAKVAIARPLGPPSGAAGLRGPGTLPIEAELNAAGERDALIRLQRLARPDEPLAQRGLAGTGAVGPDRQGEVWRSVDLLQRQLSDSLATPVASERSETSLQLSLENEKLQAAQAAYVAALEPAGLAQDDVVGVAIAIDGRLASADVYPSNGLFRKMWPKIVRAAATEAIAHEAKPAGSKPAKAPDAREVLAFLEAGDATHPTERRLGALATLETRDGDRVLSVKAMAPDGRLVHRSYLAK